MHLRKAHHGERDTLLDIWLQSVRMSHTFLPEQDIQSLLPVVRHSALVEQELWVLCSESNEPIGFLGLSGTHVEALFIAPQWRGRGGGRMLVDHARQLKGALTVDVNEQNTQSVGFF